SSIRKIIFATELVYSDQQAILDLFMAGEIGDTEFLKSVNYSETFGFNWANYKPIFDFARARKIPVIAIDHRGPPRQTLYERDRRAARIICNVTLEHPETLIWVMIGDLHLAQTHLPRFVERDLAGRKQER